MPNAAIEGYTGMACVACGSPEMDAKITAKGGIYLTCVECRMKIFGLSRTKLARIKYISDLLYVEEFRKHWSEAGDLVAKQHMERIASSKENVHVG